MFVHSPEFIADVCEPGPNGARFDGLVAAAVPAGTQNLMYDSVIPADIPPDAVIVAGYFNGTFADLTALRARFPQDTEVTVTPDGAHGAMYIDVEPGDARNDAIPAFLRAGGLGFYTSASNLQAAISTCTAAGIPRDTYKAWGAHWTGLHVCGPGSCGYPQADGTQFASNQLFDTSLIVVPEFFGPPPVPPVPAVWTFGPVRSLGVLNAGYTSVRLQWTSPGGFTGPVPSPAPAVDHYLVTILLNSGVVASYPRTVIKDTGRGSAMQSALFGGLEENTIYTAEVRACLSDGSHSSPWVTVQFQTGIPHAAAPAEVSESGFIGRLYAAVKAAFVTYPGGTAAVLGVLVALLARFGFHVTVTQLTAIMSVVVVLAGVFVHTATVSKAKLKLAKK